jgi:hypothetical protein
VYGAGYCLELPSEAELQPEKVISKVDS